MKRNHYLFTLILLLGCSIFVKASDTVFVHQTQIPILIERQDNVYKCNLLLFIVIFKLLDKKHGYI